MKLASLVPLFILSDRTGKRRLTGVVGVAARVFVCGALLFSPALSLGAEAEPAEAEPAEAATTNAAGQNAEEGPLSPAATFFGSRGTLIPENERGSFKEWNLWQQTLEGMKEGNTLDTGFMEMPKHVYWQWEHVLRQYPSAPEIEKLRLISGFFNNWPQVEDIRAYGQEEYWATAREFMEKSGDCEDFVIVKFQALKLLGWPADNLWLVLVKDLTRPGRLHAVLAAKGAERLFLLDNLSSPGNLVMELSMYKSIYTPLAAMNEKELWLFPEARKKLE
jgi:Predicted periplasmic protein